MSEALTLIESRLALIWDATAEALLFDGAAPWEIDEALTEAGFSTGPFERQDAVGLDLTFHQRQKDREAGLPIPVSAVVTDRMVREGRLGRKVGVGWYRYPGGGGKVIDPLIDDLVSEEARFAGIERGAVSDAQVVETLIEAMKREAQNCLDERLSKDAANIGAVLRDAFGFPADFDFQA